MFRSHYVRHLRFNRFSAVALNPQPLPPGPPDPMPIATFKAAKTFS